MADSTSMTFQITVEIPRLLIPSHLPTREWFERQVSLDMKELILEKYQMFFTHPELYYIPLEVLNDE